MKNWRKYVAALCAVLLLLSVGITGAAYAGPQQPEITKCLWTVAKGVKSTEQKETSFVIRSSATVDPSELLTAGDDDHAIDVDIFDLIGTTYDVNFYISFPAEGGFRLRLSEDAGKSGFFSPGASDPIRYTALADGRLSMRSENGTDGTVVYYSRTATGFRLTVGNTERGELFSFTSDDLKLAYRGGEVAKTEIRLPLKTDEAIYNGGERFNDVNQRGYAFSLRNVDAAYHGSSSTSTSTSHTYSYINVPLFHSDAGYSVWYNMAYSGTADVGKADTSVFSTAFDGGKLDFYVFTGTILENIKKYTDITGKSYVPADKWVFGYWMGGGQGPWKGTDSKETYAQLKKTLSDFAAAGITPSAVYVEGYNYQQKNSYNLAKNYNTRILMWYPPRGYYAWQIQGFCGGIPLADLPIPLQAVNPTKGVFGGGGGGGSYFIDFSHPNAMKAVTGRLSEWWSWGLKGAMIDYGEWLYDDCYCYNGLYGDEMHNLISYYYAKVSAEAWSSYYKNNDYILFERSGFTGSHAFVANFTGDNPSTWEGLKDQIHGIISMGTGGFNVVGGDMGGFNRCNSAELYMRWVQYSAFCALMRVHSGSELRDMAWMQNKGDLTVDTFMNYYYLRQNLQDALYSAAADAGNTSVPMTQALGVAYQGQNGVKSINDQYLFCNSLLVSPITASGVYYRSMLLPEGNWYNLWDASRVEGGKTIDAEAPTTVIPVYVKSGAVIPLTLPKSLELCEAMTDGQYKALLITPPDNLTNTTVYTAKDKSITYTSRYKNAYSYSLSANAANTTRVVIAYGTNAASVTVDGTALQALDHLPDVTENEVGFYAVGNDRTVMLLPTGWRTLEVRTTGAEYEAIPLQAMYPRTARNLTDGNVKTVYSVPTTAGAYIKFALAQKATIDTLVMRWANQYATDYTVEVSENGSTWTTVYTKTGGFGGIERIHFTPVSAAYIRLSNFTAASTTAGMRLYEVEVYPETATSTKFESSVSGLLGYNTSKEGKYPNGQDYYICTTNAALAEEFSSYMDDRYTLIYTDHDGSSRTLVPKTCLETGKEGWRCNALYINRFLQFTGGTTVSDVSLRYIGALVPKVDGNYLKMKNFTVSYGMRFEKTTGSVVFGFRQSIPAGFFSDSGVNTAQAYLQVSSNAVTLYDHGTVKTLYTYTGKKPGSDANSRNMRVTLTVAGDRLDYTVKPDSSTVDTVSGSTTIENADAGYMALGIAGASHGLELLNVQELPEDHGTNYPQVTVSDAVKNGSLTVKRASSTPNAQGAYAYTVTVTPDASYELRTGSLLVTDVDGNAQIPVRVGFQNGGSGTTFRFYAKTDTVVKATFAAPNKTILNAGVLGTSVNETKKGLRFIYRLQRTVENGKSYILQNGVKTEIIDYGMLVSTDAQVGNQRLDAKLAAANSRIKMVSVKDANRYYDYCDDYVDMCVQIINIGSNIQNLNLVANAYVQLADGTYLYANGYTTNYAAAQ